MNDDYEFEDLLEDLYFSGYDVDPLQEAPGDTNRNRRNNDDDEEDTPAVQVGGNLRGDGNDLNDDVDYGKDTDPPQDDEEEENTDDTTEDQNENQPAEADAQQQNTPADNTDDVDFGANTEPPTEEEEPAETDAAPAQNPETAPENNNPAENNTNTANNDVRSDNNPPNTANTATDTAGTQDTNQPAGAAAGDDVDFGAGTEPPGDEPDDNAGGDDNADGDTTDDQNADDAGGDDTGDDADTEDDTGGDTDTAGGGDDEMNQLQADTFSDLTEDQLKIRINKLKDSYIDLYAAIEDTIDRLTDVNKGSDTINAINFINDQLFSMKTMVRDALVDSFSTRSLIENQILLERFIASFSMINKFIERLVSKDSSEDKNKKEKSTT